MNLHTMNMKNLILLTGIFAITLTALIGCGKKDAGSDIASLEAKFKELTTGENLKDKTGEIRDVMGKLAVAYERAGQSKDPEIAVKNLYLAAEMYETNQLDVSKSLGLYQKIFNEYPDHDRAADALFKMGYIYNNMLNDLPNAEKMYRLFLEKYPEDQLAPSAQFEIDNLGVSPEEILKRIRPDSLNVDETDLEG
jgi:tetratricopeptide (TPR) repeat protein